MGCKLAHEDFWVKWTILILEFFEVFGGRYDVSMAALLNHIGFALNNAKLRWV